MFFIPKKLISFLFLQIHHIPLLLLLLLQFHYANASSCHCTFKATTPVRTETNIKSHSLQYIGSGTCFHGYISNGWFIVTGHPVSLQDWKYILMSRTLSMTNTSFKQVNVRFPTKLMVKVTVYNHERTVGTMFRWTYKCVHILSTTGTVLNCAYNWLTDMLIAT